MQYGPAAFVSARAIISIAAPITATIGRGALMAVTRTAIVSPIARNTVPATATATGAEVS